MSSRGVFPVLERFFSQYRDNPSAAGLAGEFRSSLVPAFEEQSPRSFQLARNLYEQALSVVEKDAADKEFEEAVLELQRGLYRELEDLLSSGSERRHHFVIVVPVADRPLMLRNFLGSLIEQCRTFGYGGDGVSQKVTAFVIDDSKDPSNISRIKAISVETTAAGLPVHYVGQAEQSGILKKVPADIRKKLSGLIGGFQGAVPGHKGASVTRNIAYLYLRCRMAAFPENTLLWFIDSDEEFRVKVKSGGEIKDIPFVNYFYWLDRIFASSNLEVLTGKVVGDPPVTPSVMINTFFEDILSFMLSVSAAEPEGPCIFHTERSSVSFSAEYHDMTGLFGYRKADAPKRYHCSLAGWHTVRDCFDDFSGRATGFFSGLHPTRTQFYVHDREFLKTEQARTVYTGNYVIRRSGFRHFIPFAGLGLRMAGPTLGRILRKRLGQRFVSINLPLLHKRTLPEKFTDEFRSGIQKEGESVDLSGEFVRQFWGDIMLFSVEDLTGKGYPGRFEETEIAAAVRKTQERIWELYERHQAEAGGKITEIKKLLEDPGQWWNLRPETQGSVRNLLGFCAVAERNFGPHSAALKKISGQREEGSMTEKIIRAIGSFQEEDRLWEELLKTICKAQE
ncbi:MAG: hypothetical protein M0Z67_08145 [Nitrospiraceae bacterium]|nr:hypothetical protein [Nitrospiraceae bacterium]